MKGHLFSINDNSTRCLKIILTKDICNVPPKTPKRGKLFLGHPVIRGYEMIVLTMGIMKVGRGIIMAKIR